MRVTQRLLLIGYWDGPDTIGPDLSSTWPSVYDYVDPAWDADERSFIAMYLSAGMIARLYMGHSTCRICGRRDNGEMELSDGVYVWPNGLAHYVLEHDVRLPQPFVEHAEAASELLQEAERDLTWWQAASPSSNS